MASRTGEVKILLKIAFRNLWASRVRSLFVGGLIALGAFLLVLCVAVVGTIDRGMSDSIQNSLGGQIQVYNAASEDKLELYGNMRGESRLEPIPDFSAVKDAIGNVPNVRHVVPMGIDQAMVATGNNLDIVFERLRGDVRRLEEAKQRGEKPDPELERAYAAHLGHSRRVVALLKEELSQARAIADLKGREANERRQEWADLTRADSEEFWKGFDGDRYGHLEFLENRIAKLSLDNAFVFLRYVGTDPDEFFQAFPLAEVAEGQMIPRGRRGILVGRQYAEEYLKLKNARRLDQIKEARDRWHRKIAKDEELQRWVKENAIGTREILLQLDPLKAEEVTRLLRKELAGAPDEDLAALLKRLFATTDADFDQKYRVFYDAVAPRIRLYSINVGDTITVKAPSKSGYFNSVNVKVWGFIKFRGIERSGIAGNMSVMDLMSFRDLYGYMTKEKAAEIARLKSSVKVKDLSRDDAEAALFGGGAEAGGDAADAGLETKQTRIDEGALLAGTKTGARPEELAARVYSQDEIDHGVVLNAALVLDDPSRIPETMAAVKKASDERKLGLGVLSWEKASGLVGDFVRTLRVIILVSLVVIFLVVLIIVNNAIGLAVLQRVKEIGTMRAVGAQRRFVLAMLLVEALALGVVFGLIGTGLGALVLGGLRAGGGIPASNDMTYFLFAGPALLPRLGFGGTLASVAIVFLVSVLSGFYPAVLAMRVTPVEAMASEE
jgi:ABC-type lipoprotein release transport system permease subunit